MAGFALLCLTLIAAAFWEQDVRYLFPTPRPPGLTQASIGSLLPVMDAHRTAGRPLLIHFFNPACPCSRFNVDHLRELTQQFGSRVQFIAALQDDQPASLQLASRSLAVPMEILDDSLGRIAAAAGVYSTPQAVLLDASGRIYFRGNYNLSRYCTDRSTEFVRIAIERLLSGAPPPSFPVSATLAYGCPFPRASKRKSMER